MFILLLASVMVTLISLIAFFVHIVEADIHNQSVNPLKLALYAVLVLGGGTTVWVVMSIENTEREQKARQAEAEWKRNGCLVYKSECGSKRKYECERKTNIPGKVMIGDILVPTYPTCAPS